MFKKSLFLLTFFVSTAHATPPQRALAAADEICDNGLAHRAGYAPAAELRDAAQTLELMDLELQMPMTGFLEPSVRAISRNDLGQVLVHSAVTRDDHVEVATSAISHPFLDLSVVTYPFPEKAKLENLYVDEDGQAIAHYEFNHQEHLRLLRAGDDGREFTVPLIKAFEVRKAVRLPRGGFAFLTHLKLANGTAYAVITNRLGAWRHLLPRQPLLGREPRHPAADLIVMFEGTPLIVVPGEDDRSLRLVSAQHKDEFAEVALPVAPRERVEAVRLYYTRESKQLLLATYRALGDGQRRLDVFRWEERQLKPIFSQTFAPDDFLRDARGTDKWSFRGLHWVTNALASEALVIERRDGDRVFPLASMK